MLDAQAQTLTNKNPPATPQHTTIRMSCGLSVGTRRSGARFEWLECEKHLPHSVYLSHPRGAVFTYYWGITWLLGKVAPIQSGPEPPLSLNTYGPYRGGEAGCAFMFYNHWIRQNLCGGPNIGGKPSWSLIHPTCTVAGKIFDCFVGPSLTIPNAKTSYDHKLPDCK